MISPGEKERLSALCKKVGFSRIDFLGEVDDATLTRELERADILSCLRKPILEGASASAIEGMKSGRPIIVADADLILIFRMISSSRYLVPSEIQPLSEVLERLVSSETLRQRDQRESEGMGNENLQCTGLCHGSREPHRAVDRGEAFASFGRTSGRDLAAIDISEDDPVIGRLAATMRVSLAPLVDWFISNPGARRVVAAHFVRCTARGKGPQWGSRKASPPRAGIDWATRGARRCAKSLLVTNDSGGKSFPVVQPTNGGAHGSPVDRKQSDPRTGAHSNLALARNGSAAQVPIPQLPT